MNTKTSYVTKVILSFRTDRSGQTLRTQIRLLLKIRFFQEQSTVCNSVCIFRTHYYMNHIMRKPVFAICEQQRRRSACASAQSDQRLVVCCLDSVISLVSISEILRLYLASVADQAGLSLNLSQTPKTGFLVQ